MSKLLSAGEAIALIPGLDAEKVSIVELKGGLTNRSFQVTRGDDRFVLRLDAEHTGLFNLDRVSELAIVRSASAAGIAPELVYVDEQHGILLYRYLSGSVWSAGDLNSSENIDALCELLRRVHTLPLSGVRFDVSRIARRYAVNLESRLGLHTFALHCEEVIARTRKPETVTCCHNDIVAQNIIATPQLRLLDWEYACDNDPLFDLASLIGYHNLDDRHANALLDSYTGGATAAHRERLAEQVRVYDAIQWLWLANRHRLSPNSGQATRLEALQQRIR